MSTAIAINVPRATCFAWVWNGGARLLKDRPSSSRVRRLALADSSTDEELMCRHRDGESGAFDELVRRHRRRVVAFVARMGVGQARSEEISSDVFLKLHRAAPGYEPTARFTTYLYTVAYRATLNVQDKASNRRERPVGGSVELEEREAQGLKAVSDGAEAVENAVDSARALRRLDQEISELTEDLRAPFLLYYREGMSCVEVAECLQARPEEIKGRLAYARRLIRERMADLLAERRDSGQ